MVESVGDVMNNVHQTEASLCTSTTTPKAGSPSLMEKYGLTTPSMEETRTGSSPLFHQQHGIQE